MKKGFKCLLILLALLCLSQELQAATVSILSAKQEPGVSVKVVGDLKQYNQSNPAMHLQELNRTVLYTFGERVFGDKVLSVIEETSYFPLIGQSTSTSGVTFPETKNSTVLITGVEIRFKGNADGKVYVVDGGIGQRFISFIVEAPKTAAPFTFKTEIFGKE